jgi:hypothetical protein
MAARRQASPGSLNYGILLQRTISLASEDRLR